MKDIITIKDIGGEIRLGCKKRQEEWWTYKGGKVSLPQLKADIIHICGFDSYNPTDAILSNIEPHESGNYIIFNLLRDIKKYSSMMVLTDMLGQVLTRNDDDTIGIPMEKVLDSIVECKIIMLHDHGLSFELMHQLHEKLDCKFIFVSQTHYHLTHPNAEGDTSYPELATEDIKLRNLPLILEKKAHFDKLPITMVVGSSYSYRQTIESPLYEVHNTTLIPLPADIPFCKSPKAAVREHLGLLPDKKYVFWGTTSHTLKRKGYKYFIDAMTALEQLLTPEQAAQVEIIYAGHSLNRSSLGPFPILANGYVTSRQEMSVLYRAAHVAVSTTLADAGPMMISESLCNETPVVAFPPCIAGDLIEDGVSGYLVKEYNAKSMACQIKKALFQSDLEQMSINARKKYLAFHNKEEILQSWQVILDSLM